MTQMTPPPDASPPALPPPSPPVVMPVSPRWSVATKFLAALVIIVLVGALLSRFQVLLPPLILAFILAYLLSPVVDRFSTRTGLPWGASVAIVFVSLLLLTVAVLVVAGIAIEQQIEGLYHAVVEILPDLPERLQLLLSQPFTLGPFRIDPTQPVRVGPFVIFDPATVDLVPLYNQVVAYLQPALSRTGTLIGSLASGTAEVIGWILFILIIAYYLLHDVKTLMPSIEQVLPQGYAYDARRLAAELGPIWNAFLRGQITLALVMGLTVGITMGLLGVRYAPVLGLLAGLLEFIPIIGPFIAGAVAVLVALFQPTNWLGLSPLYFALVVLVVQILLQQLENNFLVPRIIGGSLNLHPIVIIVGAFIAASLAGVVGLLLSAPTIATLKLFGRYIYRKLFDLNPWPDPPPAPPPPASSLEWPPRWLRRLLRGRAERA